MTRPAPRAVVADLEVLAALRAAMTASGYGDLWARSPPGRTGWSPTRSASSRSIRGSGSWCRACCARRSGGPRPWPPATGALERLVEGLVMSGLAMQAHASSRPASGAEHQFSHLWEMEGLGTTGGRRCRTASRSASARSPSPPSTSGFWSATLGALDVEGLRRAWPGPGGGRGGGPGRARPRAWTRPPWPRLRQARRPRDARRRLELSPTAGRGSAAAFRNSSSRPRGCGSCWPRPAARPGRRSWG